MKKYILIFSLLILPLFAHAETTVSQTIDRIQIQGHASGGTYYYFYNATGWGAASCPNSVYAYMKSDDPGAKEMLQLGIEAKKIGAKVKFHGDCAGSAYVRVNYMYFE
ncbi:MAG TPA: hypothetical protein ENJ28_03290 [Gammaproteobacteria bacterium]|nr:hypothetical protein [Gammaproteobacteria bacterium]